jgi:hypothetical protein
MHDITHFCDIMYDVMYDIMSNVCLEQEIVVNLAPFPNDPNPFAEFDVRPDFDLNGDDLVWYARPQLFFNCTLCSHYCQGPEYLAYHKEVSLLYFRTLRPTTRRCPRCISARLSPSIWPQIVSSVPMLDYTASNQRLLSLYICPVANVLGRAPLIPCFIDCNTHLTFPCKFKKNILG